MSENVVSDSACLIGLERIGRSEILAQSFKTIYIPPAVEKELGYKMEWLVVQPVRNVAFVKTLQIQLGEGESEAMVLAIELGEVLVLDDKKARRIAQQIGLKIIGTVGVLLRAKERGAITEVKPILDELNAVDFRISPALYHQALRLAGEI
jgi:predicted nucleic acid-binding protein